MNDQIFSIDLIFKEFLNLPVSLNSLKSRLDR